MRQRRDAAGNRPGHAGGCRVLDQIVPDGAGRRAVAGAHAGRGDDPRARRRRLAQRRHQPRAAGHGAGQALADTDRHRLGRGRVIRAQVEMGVEARHLEDLHRRDAQQLRQRQQVALAEATVTVLDRMQMLDEQVAARHRAAECGRHLAPRGLARHPAARAGARRPAAHPRRGDRLRVTGHASRPLRVRQAGTFDRLLNRFFLVEQLGAARREGQVAATHGFARSDGAAPPTLRSSPCQAATARPKTWQEEAHAAHDRPRPSRSVAGGAARAGAVAAAGGQHRFRRGDERGAAQRDGRTRARRPERPAAEATTSPRPGGGGPDERRPEGNLGSGAAMTGSQRNATGLPSSGGGATVPAPTTNSPRQ
jgi:hypothetical protein